MSIGEKIASKVIEKTGLLVSEEQIIKPTESSPGGES